MITIQDDVAFVVLRAVLLQRGDDLLGGHAFRKDFRDCKEPFDHRFSFVRRSFLLVAHACSNGSVLS